MMGCMRVLHHHGPRWTPTPAERHLLLLPLQPRGLDHLRIGLGGGGEDPARFLDGERELVRVEQPHVRALRHGRRRQPRVRAGDVPHEWQDERPVRGDPCCVVLVGTARVRQDAIENGAERGAVVHCVGRTPRHRGKRESIVVRQPVAIGGVAGGTHDGARVGVAGGDQLFGAAPRHREGIDGAVVQDEDARGVHRANEVGGSRFIDGRPFHAGCLSKRVRGARGVSCGRVRICFRRGGIVGFVLGVRRLMRLPSANIS
mmetsp:Transcript_53730/g.165329  ORF Transcript_53730/g.165329 Transcript_53730/m.165329 type:complete len:259 (-) Transcript_53730:1304-2080(-)